MLNTHEDQFAMNASSADGSIIEIRPLKAAGSVTKGPGVGPYWMGDTAKEDAISYATARAKIEECDGERSGDFIYIKPIW
jgi:hypothetical protein